MVLNVVRFEKIKNFINKERNLSKESLEDKGRDRLFNFVVSNDV